MNELDFLQQLLQNQQSGAGFLGSTTQYRSPITANTVMPAANALMTGLTGVGSGAGAASAIADTAKTATDTASGFSKALPFVGLGITAASTIMSFVEAGKAADAQNAAMKEAERQRAEQKRLLQQNFYEALKVPTEAFDRQFREGTAANAQAVEALSQDPRMLLGGIQGVQEATIEGQAKAREALADRLFSLDVAKADAATKQAGALANFAGEEAAGAQVAAMAAEKAKIAQQQSAMQGVGNLITQGTGMVGTYGNLATPEDNLSSLSSSVNNSMFGNKQPSSNQMMQYLMQNPEMLQRAMQMMQKTT